MTKKDTATAVKVALKMSKLNALNLNAALYLLGKEPSNGKKLIKN
jgi:hypothetical protein